MGKKYRTTESFIRDANVIHNNRYSYENTEYIHQNMKTFAECPEHGKFQIIPKTHLKGAKCEKCVFDDTGNRCRKSNDKFIQDAIRIHGVKYDYSKMVYKNSNTPIKIICPKHGAFMQAPMGHLIGRPCRKCSNEKRLWRTGCYSYENFVNHPESKEKDALLYVARINYAKDDFFKIGITVKTTIKARFYAKKRTDTNIIPIVEFKTTLFDAFTREQFLLESLKPHKYYPNRKFGGYTECLKINDDTISTLSEYFNINIRDMIHNSDNI